MASVQLGPFLDAEWNSTAIFCKRKGKMHFFFFLHNAEVANILYEEHVLFFHVENIDIKNSRYRVGKGNHFC